MQEVPYEMAVILYNVLWQKKILTTLKKPKNPTYFS